MAGAPGSSAMIGLQRDTKVWSNTPHNTQAVREQRSHIPTRAPAIGSRADGRWSALGVGSAYGERRWDIAGGTTRVGAAVSAREAVEGGGNATTRAVATDVGVAQIRIRRRLDNCELQRHIRGSHAQLWHYALVYDRIKILRRATYG
eukprot:COSAG02_NODE_8171_length_2678_cov_2.196588_2_plen_147_part_00